MSQKYSNKEMVLPIKKVLSTDEYKHNQLTNLTKQLIDLYVNDEVHYYNDLIIIT